MFGSTPIPTNASGLLTRLLDRPEYADFWAEQMGRSAAAQSYRVGIKRRWLSTPGCATSFRRNVPYDQWARELVTAQGVHLAQWGGHLVSRSAHARRDHDGGQPTFLGQFDWNAPSATTIRSKCGARTIFIKWPAYFRPRGRKGGGLVAVHQRAKRWCLSAKAGIVGAPAHRPACASSPAVRATAAIAPDDDPRASLVDWMVSKENASFAAGWREPDVGRADGTRNCRSGRRPCGPPIRPATCRCSSVLADEFRRLGLRSESCFADRRLVRLSLDRCPTSAIWPTRATIRATIADSCGPRRCSMRCAT